jgi:ATP-dependent DNA helicase RecQ
LAREQGVAPYVVFHDSTLRAMVQLRPQTEEEFLEVPGVGKAKLARYGEAFLSELAQA